MVSDTSLQSFDSCFQGKLKGFDVRTNIIMSDCVEREYSVEGVEMIPLGLYMIKGDNV